MRTHCLVKAPRILAPSACSVPIKPKFPQIVHTIRRQSTRLFSSNVAKAQSIQDIRSGRKTVFALPDVSPIPISPAVTNLSDALTRKPVPEKVWFGIYEQLRVALSEMGITQPSEIQRLAIPAVLSGKDAVLSAATGTGKTLSYLLPIAHKLKMEELENGITARPGRPRAIVLAPTRELALQIASVAKQLCHKAKFSVGVLVGGRKERWQREMCEKPVDLMIGTSGRFLQAIDRNWLSLNDVRLAVIDESDTMIDANQEESGFTRDMERLIRPLMIASERRKQEAQEVFSSINAQPAPNTPLSIDSSVFCNTNGKTVPFPVASFLAARNTSQSFLYPLAVKTQFICVGATMNAKAIQAARNLIPTLELVATASTLRPPTTLEQKFIRVGGDPSSKHAYLRETLETILPVTTAWVSDSDFESEDDGSDEEVEEIRQNARVVAQTLTLKGNTRSSPKNARVIVFCNSINSCRSTAHFIGELGYKVASLHGEIPPRLRQSEYELFNSKKCSVLVATDASARGLDFQDVSHVIVFDFPLNPAEYLHRVGRTARGNNPGVAISFVTKRDAALALAIERASAESVASRNQKHRKASTVPDTDELGAEFKADTVTSQSLPVTAIDFTAFSANKYDYVPPKLRGEYKAALARREQKKGERVLNGNSQGPFRSESKGAREYTATSNSVSASKWSGFQSSMRSKSADASSNRAQDKDPFVSLRKEQNSEPKKYSKTRMD